ncbi:jg11437 [Pararge aegeria aegeria]|uniref:Jg11437 protein n=1 Tax=Pararge aegeria aegeria TaxID=348720 RepID=A0A8S4RVM4_9NEOP|nr:jg11437 [Pararge aegeria aegeria]
MRRAKCGLEDCTCILEHYVELTGIQPDKFSMGFQRVLKSTDANKASVLGIRRTPFHSDSRNGYGWITTMMSKISAYALFNKSFDVNLDSVD